ncbi:Hypothetical_protein [Hexamita inflata]|uniref:Hypothetical_protein n=1 Tax=Hexamita inflata TaxID=28002 RepID=A0AA86Q777_9EUKA|nr:Hypothetical protein HINF_LOCUS40198 [Hexamita inflata]
MIDWVMNQKWNMTDMKSIWKLKAFQSSETTDQILNISNTLSCLQCQLNIPYYFRQHKMNNRQIDKSQEVYGHQIQIEFQPDDIWGFHLHGCVYIYISRLIQIILKRCCIKVYRVSVKIIDI